MVQNFTYDPIQRADLLRQALSQDERPLGFLLGAGCPQAITTACEDKAVPLIPGIEGLTTTVCGQMQSSRLHQKNFEQVLANCKKDGEDTPDLEFFLAHIRSLRSVSGKDCVRGLTCAQLDELDREICNIVVQAVDKPLPLVDTPYHMLASWIGSIRRDAPVEIFTTNYDLLMEEALEQRKVPFFDGFVGSHYPFFDLHAIEEDALPPRWARLWKLHGSVNWWQNGRGVFRCASMSDAERRVIHPSHLKYEEGRRIPYLAMLDQLRRFLKQPSPVLVVCGYSFRDKDINEILEQGLHVNPTCALFGLLFGSLSVYAPAVELSSARSNCSLFAEDEGVIGKKRARWSQSRDTSMPDRRGAVEWRYLDEKDHERGFSPKFKLGDFSWLGSFLDDIGGPGRSMRNQS